MQYRRTQTLTLTLTISPLPLMTTTIPSVLSKQTKLNFLGFGSSSSSSLISASSSSTMKLRARSLESKETIRIEVPNSCTLHQFKQTLSQQISSSSSSVFVSLNRKDELFGSSPHESLQSIGVTSGDLVFYSLNPNVFIPQTLVPTIPNTEISLNLGQEISESDMGRTEFGESETLGSNSHIEQEAAIEPQSVQQHVSEVGVGVTNIGESETLIRSHPQEHQQLSESDVSYCSESDLEEADTGESETLDLNTQKEENVENMDVDEGSGSGSVGRRFSVPSFLRKVLRDELADDGSDHRLLVIAVHAVLLESGFVGFDSVSGMRVDRFHLPDVWPSSAFSISLWYTLPELVNSGSDVIETVILKFQNLGQFINIYGSLGRNGSGLYKVCLDEYRFASTLDLVWAKHDLTYGMSGNNEHNNSNSYPENVVFEFWKIVKDGLALPLLIDLCDRAGLLPPPCMMRLPSDLKFKILEFISGVDLAKVGSVCSELRFLSSNNDLWKQKYVEEFGTLPDEQAVSSWKDKFISSWESRKERKRPRNPWRAYPRISRPFYFPIRSDPDPFGLMPMIGGDYDRLPVLGIGTPPAYRRPTRAVPRHAGFSPNCNLGGFNG